MKYKLKKPRITSIRSDSQETVIGKNGEKFSDRLSIPRAPLIVIALIAGALGLYTLINSLAATPQPTIYWGSWIDGDTYGSNLADAPWKDEATQKQTAWDMFEQHTGKKVSIVHYGQPPMWEQAFAAGTASLVTDRGAIPMMDMSSKEVSLTSIANGTYDSSIKTWASAAKNWGKPFFFRWNWEMNGTWFNWGAQAQQNPAAYVAAWRHMHDLVVAQGATNVTWVWCPNTKFPGSTPLNPSNPSNALYPGDAYVDWTCIDGYNKGPLDGDSWVSFSQIFQPTYDEILQVAPTKPIMIGETASNEDGGSKKAAWITDALQTQLPNNFPKVKAFVWFNWPIFENNVNQQWPIESSPAAQAAFASGIASPAYASNTFGNLPALTKVQPLASTPPSDTTAPTISLTAPAASATVSGTATTVSATASDDTGVAGVQFKLDGNNLGSEDTSSPYSTTWNTTSASNGTHTLTAVARDAAGNTKTSSSVSVTVNNAASGSTSFYIRDGGSSSTCTDWANACDALPATLQRGATYYIASGTYAGRTFNTAASGTQAITIKGATVANHGTGTGWNAAYSVSTSDGGSQAVWTSGISFNTSYWVFDGSVGPVWSRAANQYGFKFNPVNYAVRVYNTGAAITDVDISHIAATAPGGDVEKFFLSTDNSTKSVNNVTFSNCLLDGWSNAVWATSAGLQMNNWLVENNVILNGFSSAANHGEDINNNYGHLDNLTVRYNWFEGRTGSTGSIVVLNGPAGPYFIYGNVFKNMEGGDGIITGVHYTLSGAIYNNTFDNVDNGYGNGDWIGHDVSATVSNNIVANGVAAIGGTFTGTKDYNAYFNTTNTPSEAHGYTSTTSPFVNGAGGNLHLTSAAASAMPAGTTLAAPYNMDVEGNMRGADGKWDRGAYAYTGTTPPPPSDTAAPTVAFSSPTNGATVSGTVTATATATDDTGVTKVEISLDSSLKMTDTAAPYNYSFDSKTLSNGSHTLTAKAYDAAGNTKSVTITITVSNPDTTPPNAPTNLNATAPTSTSVNLTWTAATDTGTNPSGVTKYNVLRNGVVIAQPTTTSYTDTGRTANTTYSYVVQAVDAAGNVSANSNTDSVTTPPPPTTPDTTAPTVPGNVAATAASPNQVNISWNASTDSGGSGLAGYNVYRGSTKLNSSPVTTTTYGDSTAAAGTAYSYKVEAVDGAGNKSAQSSSATVTTPAAKRGDITGSSGAPDGKIDLTDISYVIRKYNTTDANGDISGPNGTPDGKVDLFDLSYVIRNYGQ